MRNFVVLLFFSFGSFFSEAQNCWQQKANYTIDVQLDPSQHTFKGNQRIVYFNESPEDLTHLYFHLYFNAFQPGSAMDVRSRLIEDPDPRVGNRIAQLKPEEEGHLHVQSMTVNGKKTTLTENGTILEVALEQPISAGSKATIELDFDGVVPIQIRRSGRNNAEGIEYSMSQWYPKLCEYDKDGWHPNPYIGREFYGIWGDWEVNITLPQRYTVAATGELSNPQEIGKGFSDSDAKVKVVNDQLTWKWKAKNVHDFVWAADPDYVHTQLQVTDGPLLHFFYQSDPTIQENWKKLPEFTAKAFEHLSKHFGKYPYPVYSVIQGGDGGMEYPMATLITGNRKLPSLVGVTVHEAAHSWYQGVLATNESLYPWMDEGFTSYASAEVMQELFTSAFGPHENAYSDYISLATSGKEEALSTHADHYETNEAYGSASYSKGEVYLAQLGYVIGEEVLDKVMLRYFEMWKFKHPTALDFLRIAELESGMVLDWYHEYFVNTTKTIDYGIGGLKGGASQTEVYLKREGLMPMPVEVEVTDLADKKTTFYIPLDLMRGEKKETQNWSILPDWEWVRPVYLLRIPLPASQIKSITIDPKEGMADIDRSNNTLDLEQGVEFILLD
jgi:hypothetical protein